VGGKIIIAGGGTGGHIFPAIAIANELKRMRPGMEILFIGAKGKMEMEKVPQAGYRIEGLDISGFNRSSLIKNIGLPFKLVKSFFRVKKILKREKPDAVIGVGGYSSFPVLKAAQGKRIPTFIHESNSFAGKSNIWLGKKATKIFTGTRGMEKFFPASKILVTGNPVRKAIANASVAREEGLKFFGLDPARKTVLVVGGSQGARSINEVIDKDLEEIIGAGLQLIWQTGKPYAEIAKQRTAGMKGIWANDFITLMENAYAAADVVVARSGAMTVAELCVARKPVLFVPFPFAAEDHQTVNARQLVDEEAALMIPDSEAGSRLVTELVKLAKDESKQASLRFNIAKMGIVNADEVIAKEILKVLEH
jgi:UDP-N-acetylglucosamine--N-acetylmuramyl-(pentapeptide) pyrophosphoryl-undecaprenol N-acetylglucosamine transferase